MIFSLSYIMKDMTERKLIMNYEDNLVIRAKNGDYNAINLLLDNNKSCIYAIAFAVLKNHEDAEDATQKTMITVWHSIGTLENPEAFKSWLYRIAHTRSLNVLQSKKNNRFILDDDISDMPQLEDMENEFMLPQAYAERDDLRERLNRIINGLSAVQRETIVLYYFNDRSVAEIAEIMDCSENTVKSRLYLARNSIKTKIEEQERKSGEKFFGIAAGVIPIGKLIAEHASKTALQPAESARILNSAYAAAIYGAKSAGGTSAAGYAGAVAAKTGLSAGAKAAIIVGVAVAAIGAAVGTIAIVDSMNKYLYTQRVNTSDKASPTYVPSITIPSTAPATTYYVPETTAAPTSLKCDSAFSAYKSVLEQNAGAIKAYDWQFSDGSESKPVVLADIMGDETPELIFVYETVENNTKHSRLEIYTYENGECKDVFFENDYLQTQLQTIPSYFMFQQNDDKSLYIAKHENKVGDSFKIFRLFAQNGIIGSGETIYIFESFNGVSSTKSAKIDSLNADYDTAKAKEGQLFDNISNLLMKSGNLPAEYSEAAAKHTNESMTYSEAIEYLKNGG